MAHLCVHAEQKIVGGGERRFSQLLSVIGSVHCRLLQVLKGSSVSSTSSVSFYLKVPIR